MDKAGDMDQGGNIEGADAGKSVIELLQERTGEAPRVSLRDEESGAVAAPLIDASSVEKKAVPTGRCNYQLMGEIARGGMGVILKGHDTDLGRDVAVKVLDKRLSERPDVVQRFVEEAQIGGQLQHPGIVPVYELGLMADERPFFTMKLVKGRTLATLLTERASPEAGRRNLIDIFESICQTMAYAHSRGVIHRDLKPANIMVGAFGEVQVVDWGLAKVMAHGGTADEKRAREAHSSMTILETVRSDGSGSGSESMVGSVMGTPAYMPPEQASGLVDRLDERSDVFALGAILCEILTGLPPYVGDRNEIIAAAAQAEYEEAMARLDASGTDAELIKLVKQCLMAAPAARPASAGILAERIHEHVVSIEERAHLAQVEAAEARVRVREEQKARKLTLALGGTVLVALLAGGAGWIFLQEQEAERERAAAALIAEEALRKSELTAEVNGMLAQASLFEAAHQWDEAILEAQKAAALAEGGDAGPELAGKVQLALAGFQSAQAAELAQRERERDTEQMLLELGLDPEPNMQSLQGDDRALAEEQAAGIQAIFEAHQIDLFKGTEEQAAQLLLDRNLGADIALILDRWVDSLRFTSQSEAAERILRIAHLVDTDPLRADLREAFARREMEVLHWIAESDFALQPPGTIELLGFALQRLDDREKAREVYQAGIELYPNHFGLRYRLGKMLLPNGMGMLPAADLNEGMAHIQAALGLRPESNILRFHLGRYLGKLELHDQSLRQFEILARRTPDDVRVKFHRAHALMNTGRLERAMAIFEELIPIRNPRWLSPFSIGGVGQCLAQLGQTEQAAERLEAALESGFNNTAWTNALVDIYKDQVENLDAVVERLLAKFSYDAELMNNLAWSLIMENPTDQNLVLAVRLGEQAVKAAPQQSIFWNTLGVGLYYAGDYEGAIDALSNSMSYEGWNVYDSLTMSMALHGLGRTAEARQEYQRAVEFLDNSISLDRETLYFRDEARRVFGD